MKKSFSRRRDLTIQIRRAGRLLDKIIVLSRSKDLTPRAGTIGRVFSSAGFKQLSRILRLSSEKALNQSPAIVKLTHNKSDTQLTTRRIFALLTQYALYVIGISSGNKTTRPSEGKLSSCGKLRNWIV